MLQSITNFFKLVFFLRVIGFHINKLDGHLNPTVSENRLMPESEIKEYCKINKHNIVSWFKIKSQDSDSDIYDNFRRLVSQFNKPYAKLALVLIPDSFHLANNIETLARRIILIKSLGADIKCTNPDYPDPFQNALKYLSFSNGPSFSSSKSGKEILKKAYRGEVLGKIPYGYKSHNGRLVIDDEESKIVKLIFKWYSESFYGLRIISKLLNQRGHRTKSGRIWTPLTIRSVITNRSYIGTYTRYGIRITSNHEPIIGVDLFNNVNSILNSKNTTKKKYYKSTFLLSRKIICEICGNTLTGITRRRKWKLKNNESKSKVYRYYRCQYRLRNISENSKFHSLLNADVVEKDVKDIIFSWSDDFISNLSPISSKTYTQEIEEAYSYFVNAFQDYSIGKNDISHLENSLTRLSQIRENKNVYSSKPNHIIYNQIFSNDIEESKISINQIISKILIQNNKITVTPYL